MRTKSTERDARKGTNDPQVRSRPSREPATHESSDATTTRLDLQPPNPTSAEQRLEFDVR